MFTRLCDVTVQRVHRTLTRSTLRRLAVARREWKYQGSLLCMM